MMVVMLLFLAPVLHCSGASQESNRGTAFVSGAAKLKCNFNNAQNFSLNELTFYWQVGNEVVYVMRHGNEEKSWLDNKHKSRTMVFQPNGDLTMYNITHHDMKKYTCYVLVRTQKEHESTFQLDVIANFTIPEIGISSTSPLILNQGVTVNLPCSSANGFPKPQKMFWRVSDENGTTPYYPEHEITNISSGFNISSILSWKVQHNVNITCVLAAHDGESSSKALEIKLNKKPQKPDHNDAIIPSIIAPIIILTMAVIILLICLRNKCRNCQADAPQREEEMAALKSDGNNQPVPAQITKANEMDCGSSGERL